MKIRNFIFLTVLLLAYSYAAFAAVGTFYWYDGEIVRGNKINAALDEKFTQGIVSSIQTISATNTLVVPLGYAFTKISPTGASATNLLSIAVATEGSIIYIFNGTPDSTSGVATITPQHVGAVFYGSGSWRLLYNN